MARRRAGVMMSFPGSVLELKYVLSTYATRASPPALRCAVPAARCVRYYERGSFEEWVQGSRGHGAPSLCSQLDTAQCKAHSQCTRLLLRYASACASQQWHQQGRVVGTSRTRCNVTHR